MKSNKKVRTQEPPITALPAAAQPVGPVQLLNNNFDNFCKEHFPAQWDEKDDQTILRAVWMAASSQSVEQLIGSAGFPLRDAGKGQFDMLKQLITSGAAA